MHRISCPVKALDCCPFSVTRGAELILYVAIYQIHRNVQPSRFPNQLYLLMTCQNTAEIRTVCALLEWQTCPKVLTWIHHHPLNGGEGQNVTVHFNVCKTSRLENWKKKSKRTSHPTDHPFFFRVRRQNVILHFDVLPVFDVLSAALVTFFPPLQFSKILLKWGGESKKVLYCYILTSPPQIG